MRASEGLRNGLRERLKEGLRNGLREGLSGGPSAALHHLGNRDHIVPVVPNVQTLMRPLCTYVYSYYIKCTRSLYQPIKGALGFHL